MKRHHFCNRFSPYYKCVLKRTGIVVSKEQILECAFGCIKENGVKKFRIEELAKRLHISKKTVYEFFENKNDLIVCTIDAGFGKLIERLDRIALKCENPLHAFYSLAVEACNFFVSMPCYVMEELKNNKITAKCVEKLFSALDRIAKEELAMAISGGLVISGVDLQLMAGLLKDQLKIYDTIEESRYTLAEISFYRIATILNGVATEKGRTEIDKLMSWERDL